MQPLPPNGFWSYARADDRNSGGQVSLLREKLGRVDGFHPHQNACETDNGVVAGRGLLASHGDALEPLQFAHRLFDPGARPV